MPRSQTGGGVAPLSLDFGDKWRSDVNVTPTPLYTRESTPVPTEVRAETTPERVWAWFLEQKVSSKDSNTGPSIP